MQIWNLNGIMRKKLSLQIPKNFFINEQPAPQKFDFLNDNLLKVGKGIMVGQNEFMKIDTSKTIIT